MKNIIKNYVKCSIANKYALLGYVSLMGSMFLNLDELDIKNQDKWKYGLHLLSSITLIMSRAGLGTLKHYLRAKEFIQRSERNNPRYESGEMPYCERVGWNLAIKESKLEKSLLDN